MLDVGEREGTWKSAILLLTLQQLLYHTAMNLLIPHDAGPFGDGAIEGAENWTHNSKMVSLKGGC